jgi:hypothetical protein
MRPATVNWEEALVRLNCRRAKVEQTLFLSGRSS